MISLLAAFSLAVSTAAVTPRVPGAPAAVADSVARPTVAEPGGQAASPDTTAGTTGPRAASVPADTGGSRRPRAVEYSDWYGRRLTIHRIASYTLLPLAAAEYVLGDRLIRQQEGAVRGTDYVHSGTRNAHVATAGAIAGLFTLNTVTGLWNLYDARHDPAGRRLRTTHTVLMLAADAGFVATGLLAGSASDREADDGSGSGARTHRNAALVSIGVGTIGSAIMWFRRD